MLSKNTSGIYGLIGTQVVTSEMTLYWYYNLLGNKTRPNIVYNCLHLCSQLKIACAWMCGLCMCLCSVYSILWKEDKARECDEGQDDLLYNSTTSYMEWENSVLISNMFSSNRHERKERGATGKQWVFANIFCCFFYSVHDTYVAP